MQSRSLKVCLLLLASTLVLLATSRVARAHTMGLSSGRYEAMGSLVHVEIAVARAELLGSCAGLDADSDQTISPSELARAPDCLDLRGKLQVTADGAPCIASPVDASLTESDGAMLRLTFTCPARPERVAIDDAWLARLPASHTHVARAKGREERDLVVTGKNTRFEIEPSDPAPAPPSGPRKEGAQPSLFQLGVTHILGSGGLDHLAFLLGLVLVPGVLGRARARALLVAITAFSVGHTLSLALSVSGVFVPSARFVEPLIALSIAWVGAENLLAKVPGRRALVTLPFGFVHGFGFAASLRQIMGTGVGLSLFTFNLGVEAGQVVAVLPMIAMAYGLGRGGVLGERIRRVSNVGLVAGGVGLAIARLL